MQNTLYTTITTIHHINGDGETA